MACHGVAMRYAWALVVLSACGEPDFTGDYVGTLDLSAQCDTVSFYVGTATTRFTIQESYETILVPAPSDLFRCGGMHGKKTGNTVTLSSTFCPEFTNSRGSKIQDIVKSGSTLTLDGNNLKVDIGLATTLTSPDGTKGQCSGPLTGTLIKTLFGTPKTDGGR